MKNVFTLFLFLALTVTIKAQSASTDFVAYNIYCENITSSEASNDVKGHLLANYPDRITSYIADMDSKSALITTNLQPIDLLQLYRMEGYIALFLGPDGARYRLNDPGDQMIIIKE